MDNPQTAALGGGEPPSIGMGTALANAIFDAGGKRQVELPITRSLAGSARTRPGGLYRRQRPPVLP